MTHQELKASTWEGFYRTSGILTILVGALGIAMSRLGGMLYNSGYPSTPTAYLQLISQNQSLANGLWSLWILTDFLLIAPSLALFLVLRRYNRTLALMGTVLSLFYIFYDVCVTELNSLTLASLANGYANAASDTARASFVGAATYGYYALPLQTVLSFGIGSAGWLLWSLIMSKSVFRRTTAVFGAVVNVVGVAGAAAPVIPSSALLGFFQFIAPPLIGLWFIFLGAQLYRKSGSLVAEQDRN